MLRQSCEELFTIALACLPPAVFGAGPDVGTSCVCDFCRFTNRRAREYSIAAEITALMRRKHGELRHRFARAVWVLVRSARRSRFAVPTHAGRSHRCSFTARYFESRSPICLSRSRDGSPVQSSRGSLRFPLDCSRSLRDLASHPRSLPHHSKRRRSHRRPVPLRFPGPPAPCSPSCRKRPHGAGASRRSPARR